MLDHIDFTRRVLVLVDAEIAVADAALVAGNYQTHAEYREAVGRRHGMLTMRALMVKALSPEDRKDLRIN